MARHAHLTVQVRLTKVEAEDKTTLYSARSVDPEQKLGSAHTRVTAREQAQPKQDARSHSPIATGVSPSNERGYTLPDQDAHRHTPPDQARGQSQYPHNSTPDNATGPSVPLRDKCTPDSTRGRFQVAQDSTQDSSTGPRVSPRNEGSFVLSDGTRGPRSTPPAPRQDPPPAGTKAADAAVTPRDEKRYILPVPTVHSALADKLKAAKVPGLNKAKFPTGKQHCTLAYRKRQVYALTKPSRCNQRQPSFWLTHHQCTLSLTAIMSLPQESKHVSQVTEFPAQSCCAIDFQAEQVQVC